MSNYVKTTDFAAKDALPSGNPAKVAQGTQVDTEYNNIATAIATKEDTANKGSANGYASLDGSGDVPDVQIPATIPRLSSSNTFTGGVQTISSTQPELRLNETDGTVDNRVWAILATGETLVGRVRNDASSTSADFITVNRTANTIDSIALASTVVTVNGQDVRNTAILNAGTLADARVAASNVTQHQAALTIAETQITDGSLLARLAANEAVSGQWTFTGDLRVSTATPFLRLTETGVTANNTVWEVVVEAEQLRFRVLNDIISTSANWLTVDRTANTIDAVALSSTTLTWNGNTLFTTANDGTGSGLDADTVDGSHASAFATSSHNHAASEVTSGTFSDARIAASNVTQHQASLAINASQNTSDINNQGASFSVASSMAGDFVVCDSASAMVLTVGSNCLGATGKASIFMRRGAGSVTFSASGTTIRTKTGLAITAQHGTAGLIQLSSTEYQLVGDV